MTSTSHLVLNYPQGSVVSVFVTLFLYLEPPVYFWNLWS